MRTLGKIYRYEVDLQPYLMPKHSSLVVYAITDSMIIAGTMLRKRHPNLLMYSTTEMNTCTLIDDTCSLNASVFDVHIKTNYAECTDIKVLVVTNTLEEAIKMCRDRYRLDTKKIEIFPLSGGVMLPLKISENISEHNNSIMRVG